MIEPVYRPGTESDIDQVANLLSAYMNRKLSPGRFRRLMDYRWAGEKPHIGMVATAGKDIVGFLGSVYSVRRIEGVDRTFASFTSLYVHKDWRGRNLGLNMMRTYEGRPDITYTVYDPSDRVHGLLEQCGFTDLDTHRRVWEQGMGGRGKEIEVVTERHRIADSLDGERRRYLDDHAVLPAIPMLFTNDNCRAFCFFLCQDRGPDGLCYELIYTDDPPALTGLMGPVAGWILDSDPRARLLIDERFLDGYDGTGRRQKLSCRRMVRRADPPVPDWRLDHLYSETLLLDLKLGL